MRIAVIDDEAEMRRTLVEYLARFSEESRIEMEPVEFPSGDAFLVDYRMI